MRKLTFLLEGLECYEDSRDESLQHYKTKRQRAIQK